MSTHTAWRWASMQGMLIKGKACLEPLPRLPSLSRWKGAQEMATNKAFRLWTPLEGTQPRAYGRPLRYNLKRQAEG